MVYSQVVMIFQKDSDNKSKSRRPLNTTLKKNLQDQDVGIILIMSG